MFLFSVLGVRFYGFGFRLQASRLRIWGLGFGLQGSGLRGFWLWVSIIVLFGTCSKVERKNVAMGAAGLPRTVRQALIPIDPCLANARWARECMLEHQHHVPRELPVQTQVLHLVEGLGWFRVSGFGVRGP